MEKITYNLRYYRSRIITEILKTINVLSENKIAQNQKVIADFLKIMEVHINFDQEYIIKNLSEHLPSSYLPYLEANINELKEQLKVIQLTQNNSFNVKVLEKIAQLSAEHFGYCSLLDFSVSLLPYNTQDELVENLKKTHRILFEKR
jgi:hypothetical protein